MPPTLIAFSLIILSALQLIVTQECKAKTQIPNILQDSFSLMIQQQIHELQYLYPTFIFNSFPLFTITIPKFEWREFSKIDFDILPEIDQKKGGLSLRFQYSDMKWRAIRIHFWLYERGDMGSGIVRFDNIKESTQHIKSFELANLLQASHSAKFVLFASLISMKGHTLLETFEFTIKSIPQNQIKFNISVEAGQNTFLSQIKVSYLIYYPQTFAPVNYHYGHIQTKFSYRNIFNYPLYGISIYPIKYFLMGVSSMRILAARQQSLSLTMHLSQDPTDLIRIISSSNLLDNFEAEYFFIGPSMMISCIQCQGSYILQTQENIICIESQQCQYYRSQNKNQMYFSCRQCPDSQGMKIEFDDTGKSFCECKQGYNIEMNTGRCTKYSPTSSLKQCSGIFQTRLANGTCICQQNYIRDEFGLCGGICSTKNSYWDSEQLACKCYHGYAIKPPNFTCQPIHNKCSQNQIPINNKCQCDTNTVWNQNKTKCIYCPSGRYKNSEGLCSECRRECSECVSESYCTQCYDGYYLEKFSCMEVCGDGLKMSVGEYCDDGNNVDGDGCSANCSIQDGYQCEGGSPISQDICYPESSLILATQQVIQNQPPPITTQSPIQIQPTNNITSTDTEIQPPTTNNVTYKLANIQTNYQQQIPYHLKLSRKSAVYLNSGIVIDLLLQPQINRTQEQIHNMMQILINQTEMYPQTIYLTVNKQQPKNVRCYLHYNNQLPILDFFVTIKAHFTKDIDKFVRIYVNSLTNSISNALDFDDDGQSYLL